MARKFSHDVIEKNSILLLVLTLIVVAIGGLVEITPTFLIKTTIEDVKGVRPYSPLELEGRNVYIREGCYLCHSQMIRSLRAEVERYGHYSLAAESKYDHPFQWGSANIPTNGTRFICRTRAASCPNRSCQAIPSSPTPPSTTSTSRMIFVRSS